jgi:hypothetical protein
MPYQPRLGAPHPVINIVENPDLARPLADGVIPYHYINMLNPDEETL